ncbi:MAG: peptide-binding protein [Planctomycetota bacterium]|nr:peptide-binding protein [Planctomycetota bacterium]
MENRFGFRDLVICVLLVCMMATVWIAMLQLDDHKRALNLITTVLKEQTGDLAKIRRAVEEGGSISVAPHPASTQASSGDVAGGGWQGRDLDPFARIKLAQKMPGYAVGDNFISSFGVLPDRLTPLVSQDAYAGLIQDYVLESLAGRDPETLAWVPQLAKAWTVSADGLRFEFILRKGVVFSDGEPLTVDDVVWTFKWMMNQEVEAPRARAYYEKVASVEKAGDDRVVFTFREPYFQAFELAAGMQVLPQHFYSKYTPKQFNEAIGLLMGSGAYRLPDPKNWQHEPGKPVELVRNERYWGERAPFDRMIFRILENEAARLTTFRNGDMDSLGPTPEQYRSLLQDKELLARTQHFEFDDPAAGYTYIGWNQKRNGKPTFFADKRVRRAMTMMIDREGIAQQIMLGYANVASSPFSRLTKQSDPNIKPWPYDIAAAQKLLKEAGFEDRDGDGILDSPDGKPLRFKLVYPSSSDVYKRAVLFIKDSCARAGVAVDPAPTEWNVLIQKLQQRDFDAISLAWSGGIETDPYQIFHSSQIAGTGDNAISYSNPELDALMDKARATVDEAQRMPLWHRAHQIFHEDQPYTFLLTRTSLSFVDQRIKNITRVTTGLNPRLEWYVPTDQWKWTKPAPK